MSDAPFGGTLTAPQPLLDLVVPFVPGCTHNVIRSQLLMTIREFCDRGLAWVVETNDVLLQPGFKEYSIPTGIEKTDVSWVLKAVLNECELTLKDRETQFVSRRVNKTQIVGQNTYEQPQPGLIRLHNNLEEDSTADFLVAIKPKELFLPDWFQGRHGDIIAEGCLSKLLNMAGMSWSNPKLAREYRARYFMVSKRTKHETLQSFGLVEESFTFPRFGV